MPKPKSPVPDRKRLRDHLLANSYQTETGCRIWSGYCEDYGYGRFYWEGVRDLAHRHAYRAYHGEIPDGLDVLHECDTPACIEEEHLYAGTHQRNMQDKVERGRHRGGARPGDKHHFAKLTNAQAILIKNRKLSGEHADVLAHEFGVSSGTIRRIAREATYA
jgi:HNH endonuclease